MNSFLEGARALAPGVRTSVVDSLAPERRYSIWHAADIFTSPADNIQETFGLTLVQAMACGLPVVASDWNGYRDIIADGETGYLIPTYMVKHATADSTSRLLFGELDYDHFLAERNSRSPWTSACRPKPMRISSATPSYGNEWARPVGSALVSGLHGRLSSKPTKRYGAVRRQSVWRTSRGQRGRKKGTKARPFTLPPRPHLQVTRRQPNSVTVPPLPY